MPKYYMADPIPSARMTTTLLDSSAESATTALYRAAIGSVNNDYYLPIFTRFETANQSRPSWNWAASLYTLNWMVFRQLWLAALAYITTMVGVVALLFVFGHLLFQLPESMLLNTLGVVVLLSFLIPGVYGNALLYAASRRKMAAALSASRTMKDACALLNRQASSKRRFIGLAMINLLLAGAVASSAYVTFSKTKKITLNEQQTSAASKPDETPVIESTAQIAPPSSSPATLIPVLCTTCPASVSSASSRSTLGALQDEPAIALPDPPQAAALAEPVDEPVIFVPRRPTLATPVPATPAIRHYYINVGLFADAINADNANKKLLNAGLSAFTQNLKTPKGRRTRVRVGPFNTPAEATSAAKKIRALKLEAVVIQQ